MISPSQFEKFGCDVDSLKKYFTSEEKNEDRDRLVTLTRDRIKNGRLRQLANYQLWAAIDFSYDSPLNQTTPTLVNHVLRSCHDNNPDTFIKNINDSFASWGLCESDFFCRVYDRDANGNVLRDAQGAASYKLHLDIEKFRGAIMPIGRAYLNARLAKIFNDRNLIPLFKYEPSTATEVNRVRCEIITNVVQEMATRFNYASDLRQTILNALLYSLSLEFPIEPWYEAESVNESGDEITEFEGVRYVQPHISRTFYDLQYALDTLNTDTGCTFAGHWRISRWGDVAGNKQYWNLDKVGYGYDWLDKNAPYANYFRQAFPCTMELPIPRPGSSSDREVAANYYNQNDYDRAVFLSHTFMKIVPKDFKLGTYKFPLWFQFDVASDDTVIHAKPYAYRPVTYTGYDADKNRALNASFMLELVPHQDFVTTLINQIVGTIRNNLKRIVFVDKHRVPIGFTDQMRVGRNDGEITFVETDTFKNTIAAGGRDSSAARAFERVDLPYGNTAEQFQCLAVEINLLERMVGVSPQEIGSAASHQQSKFEMQTIVGSTTNRVAYTSSFVDEGIDAKKRQLYEAIIAHKTPETIAQVSSDTPELQKHLKELGFTAEETTEGGRKVKVKGKKDKLVLEGFASTRDGPERGDDREAAQAMYMALAAINNNPRLAAVLDPQDIISMYELAAKMSGADKDFKVRVNKDALAGNTLQQAVEQVSAIVEKAIGQKIAKPAADALAEQEKKIETNEQHIQEVIGILTKLKQEIEMIAQVSQTQPPMAPAPQAAPMIPPLNATPPQSPLGPTAEVPLGMA